jgi:hypothetical protein
MDTTTAALASIGIDIGKDVFHVVGFGTNGKIAFRCKIKRLALVETFKKLPPSIVGMEACLIRFGWLPLAGPSSRAGPLRRISSNAAIHLQSLLPQSPPKSRHRGALPRRQPVRRQPTAYAGHLPRLSGASGAQLGRRARDDNDALGHAATTAHWWATGHEHPQHVLAALARLAQAGKSLSCSVQQLRGIRARAEPRDQKGRHRLVRAR